MINWKTMIGCIIDHVWLHVHNCGCFAWLYHCIIMIDTMTLFFFQILGPIPQDISGIRRQLLRLPGGFRGLGKEDGDDRPRYTDQQGWYRGSCDVTVGGRAARNCGAVSLVFIYCDLIIQWKFTLTKTEYASLSRYMNCWVSLIPNSVSGR